MKIVNVNKFYYLRGGAERYFFSLADLLQSHGHEVIPFSMQHPENLETPYAKYFPSYLEFGKQRHFNISTFQHFNIIGRMFWSFAAARKFDELLSDTKPDLIHLHNIYHQLSPSILPVAKRHKIPVVMTVHDYNLIWPDYLLAGYHPHASYWNVVRERCVQGSYAKSLLVVLEKYFHDWMRVYEKNVDRFLVPSEFVKRAFVHAGQDAKKIHVLPHFILESPVLKSSVLKPKTILYFGRLSREKGLDILLKMMQDIGSEVTLRIAGEGSEEESLQRRVQSAKLPVTFLGRLKSEQLQHEIDRALFVVAPSIVPETFGYTILESFARGKPVVASDIGAFPELVEDGKTGLLARPGDARDLREKVQYLFTHTRERQTMGKNARARAAAYTSAQHYTTLMQYYEDLL